MENEFIKVEVIENSPIIAKVTNKTNKIVSITTPDSFFYVIDTIFLLDDFEDNEKLNYLLNGEFTTECAE